MLKTSYDYFLFCDASVSSQNQQAIGAYLILKQQDLSKTSSMSANTIESLVENDIGYAHIETNKSTEAELRTFSHALEQIPTSSKVCVYTDCQNLSYLLGTRRIKLERKQFKNSKGMDLTHKNLYQKIFSLVDQYQINICKLKGHKPSKEIKTIEERIFSWIDRLSRKKLRLKNL